MKAVRMYKPGDLRVEEVAKPEMLSDEVMVKVRAVGLCGSDIRFKGRRSSKARNAIR
ncbi:hypothetical protein [Eubacterium aggregans]|uniref:hypothetical protein n=1 Tax=Eubacterium aggregans TaxID=81409 RepID=UPI003F2DFEE9